MLNVGAKLLSTDPLKDLIKEDLGEEYLTDLWFYDFATSCLNIFGSPTGLRGCLNMEDEVYYTYCASVLVMSLQEFPEVWMNLRGTPPMIAAYEFAEHYRNNRGIPLIPPYIHSGLLDGEGNEPVN